MISEAIRKKTSLVIENNEIREVIKERIKKDDNRNNTRETNIYEKVCVHAEIRENYH